MISANCIPDGGVCAAAVDQTQDRVAETGECTEHVGQHTDQHGTSAWTSQAVKIGARLVHETHKAQYLQGPACSMADQTQEVTAPSLQQIQDFCEDTWRITRRARRRPMTHMPSLPHGTRQLAATAHVEAFQRRRDHILMHSSPSNERRPLPTTAEGRTAWTPTDFDDVPTMAGSTEPPETADANDHSMNDTPEEPEGHDDTSLMQQSGFVQVAQLGRVHDPHLMKFVQQAKDVDMLNPRMRQHRGDVSPDPEHEAA
ncbi:unnamed protein product [Prorocentrum cordatum]|uniref:Uncharacterized protein n=1 Tax=Prorocentrum cordatum TaxID=2364126 RepID=A0ABN9TDH9_9DINO|nr:unnamed protein product [Polarella glacialis]